MFMRMTVLIALFLIFNGANSGQETSLFQSLVYEQLEKDEKSSLLNELFVACRIGDGSRVEHLVSIGVPVNVPDGYSRRPLMVACEYGRKKVVAVLLRNGARADDTDSKGNTASVYAKKYERDNWVRSCLRLFCGFVPISKVLSQLREEEDASQASATVTYTSYVSWSDVGNEAVSSAGPVDEYVPSSRPSVIWPPHFPT